MPRPFAIKALYLATALYWVFLCVMTHLPPRDVPKIRLNDKIEHIGAFGLLGGALVLCLWTRSFRRRIAWLAIPIGMAYGALDEWTQPWFGRSCDLNDWFADVTGLTLAVICLVLVHTLLTRKPATIEAAPVDAR